MNAVQMERAFAAQYAATDDVYMDGNTVHKAGCKQLRGKRPLRTGLGHARALGKHMCPLCLPKGGAR